MTARIDPATADKLARICGMFGSEHDGERAAAAAIADRLLRQCGVTWLDVFLARHSVDSMIDFALERGDGTLDAWQEGFLRGIRGRQFLTAKQLAKLRDIVGVVVASVQRRAAA